MTSRQRTLPGSDRPLATPEDLAAFLNDIPVKTLAQWRSKGIGPKYRKIGRHVRYDWADVHAWVARQSPDRPWWD
jgi:Helix-turn-helix domain